jgi:hypothetical protein
MSTRCNVIVKDSMSSIQLYRHCDGYPQGEHGVVEALKSALEFAWELPRFEADDFAAAIIRAWKKCGGYIYIDGIAADDWSTLHDDAAYAYVVEPPDGDDGAPMVSVFETLRKRLLWKGRIGDEFKA